MANFKNFARGPPFALWPKFPILSTLSKKCYFSTNSCGFIEILVSKKTRINCACININEVKMRLVLQILQPFKMANFENFAKGPPFAPWPKLPILSTPQKNCYFSANSCCFIEILVSKKTRIISTSIHINESKMRLVLRISKHLTFGPKKWPNFRILQMVPSLHLSQN